MEDKLVSYTEELNAIDFLEKTDFYLKSSIYNPQDWKWVFIALHGALYTIALIAARGTNDSSVIEKDGKVIGFWKALRRCVQLGFLTEVDVQQKELSIFTKDLRGGFEHYSPGIWAIQSAGLPRISNTIIEVIEKLLNSRIHVHYGDGEKERLDLVLLSIDETLRSFNRKK